MPRAFFFLVVIALAAFLLDQAVKAVFLNGFRSYNECIDLILVFNKGVAFSMFAFLKDALKWIQIALLVGVLIYTLWLQKRAYFFPIGLLLGAGFSNIFDRFLHAGVVDYVYWHCGFNFAVFNLADVMIDFAVIWLFILNFFPRFREVK